MCLAVVGVLLVVPTASSAADDDQMAYKRGLTMLRLLAYDRNLRSRTSDQLTIVVLRADSGERSQMASMLERAAGEFEVDGLTADIKELTYSDSPEFSERLADVGPSALYVPESLRDNVASIIDLTRDQSILSFTAARDLAVAGCSVSIAPKSSGDSQLELTVNRAAIRAEGVDFPAKVLKIADETLE